MTFWHWEL